MSGHWVVDPARLDSRKRFSEGLRRLREVNLYKVSLERIVKEVHVVAGSESRQRVSKSTLQRIFSGHVFPSRDQLEVLLVVLLRGEVEVETQKEQWDACWRRLRVAESLDVGELRPSVPGLQDEDRTAPAPRSGEPDGAGRSPHTPRATTGVAAAESASFPEVPGLAEAPATDEFDRLRSRVERRQVEVDQEVSEARRLAQDIIDTAWSERRRLLDQTREDLAEMVDAVTERLGRTADTLDDSVTRSTRARQDLEEVIGKVHKVADDVRVEFRNFRVAIDQAGWREKPQDPPRDV